VLRVSTEREQRVSSHELFFDLVYVFAVTQLSYWLPGHLTAEGAFETVLLLLAVWCAWVYTSWITSWFDPDRMEVRLLLVGVTLASLAMSATLPEAFDERGLGFASAYVMIQVGRTVVVLLLLARDHQLTPNLRRVFAWLVLTACFG
jgi:low temperature requirement protein LtrA